MNVENNILIKI